MSRRLNLAVCVLLPLLAARLAAATALCEPGSPADAAPDAPFRADAPGALRPEERSRLLSLEDGRYEERDGFLADRRESSPERRRLSNAQTARLLCPARGDVKKETSPGRLIAPKALPGPSAAGTLEFDGAARREERVSGPRTTQPSESPTGAAQEDSPLLKEVLTRVKLKEDADPRAAAVLRRALSDVLRTPTGQEVAADFVAQNASAEVRFDKLDGTLISVNGRKVVSGIRGEARNGSVVAINRLFLDADPELASREMAGTLAHELFGHILEEQRAKNADFPLAALHRYRGDEANGRLIGWLVRTELGAPLSDGGMWGYLKDPEAFHKSLALIDPYYALTFGPDGLADPVPVLRARLEQSRRRRESMDETDIDMRKWRFVIEHFVAEHKMERRRFASVGEDSDNFLEEYSSIKREAGEVEEDIRKRIEFYGTPEGREALRKLSEASRSEHLRAFERRLERYRTRLAMETRGRKREALVPPPPDQIDFDALEKLYQDDVRDNPRHWGL